MIAAKEDHLEANPDEEETKEMKLPKKLSNEEKARRTAIRARLAETIQRREEKIRPLKELYDQYGKSAAFFITGATFQRAREIRDAIESHTDNESWDTFAKSQTPDFEPSKLSINDIRQIIANDPELEITTKGLQVPTGVIRTTDGKNVGVNIRLKGYQGDRVQTMQFIDFFGTIDPDREIEL